VRVRVAETTGSASIVWHEGERGRLRPSLLVDGRILARWERVEVVSATTDELMALEEAGFGGMVAREREVA
jgi:hypothetical protein